MNLPPGVDIHAYHAALLTLLVAGWFLAAWLGARAAGRGATRPVLAASFTPALAALVFADEWLALSALQAPMFVWLGAHVRPRGPAGG